MSSEMEIKTQKANEVEPGKFTVSLAITAFAVTVGTVVPAGYHIGVLNALAHLIKSWCVESIYYRYNIELDENQVEFLWALIVSIFMIAGAGGSFLGASLSNKYGRKIPLLVANGLFILGSVMFLCCRITQSVELILLGRILVGLASGIATSTTPMYLSEISPANLRASLASCVALGVCFGIIFGQICSLEELFGVVDSWHQAISIPATLVIVATMFFPYLPESPVYLYVFRKNADETKKGLMKLRGGNIKEVQAELEILGAEAEEQDNIRSLWSVMTDYSLLLPLILVLVLEAGQQLSGINAVFFYSVSIFQSAGLSAKGAQWANVGSGVVNFLTVAISPIIMAKINRRPIIMWSAFFSGIFLVILTLIVLFIDLASWLPNVCILTVFSFIIAFEIGLGPVGYFIASELFESASRPAAMAFGSGCIWMFNFVTGMVFPILQISIGAYSFLPFAAICFIVVPFVRVYLPETRGKEPKEIAPLLSNGFRSKVNQKLRVNHVVPVGQSINNDTDLV